MDYLLGIDIGTSSAKATLTDLSGGIAAVAGKEYPILSPQPGWAEQDPEAWWAATCEVVGRVLRESGASPHDIRAVGLSGQMHGLVLVDGSGLPTRPAVIWPDRRSQRECEQVEERVGKDHLYETAGTPCATGFFGVSLLWVRDHEPANYERAFKALLPKDYIRMRLTGELATDVTDASGTLLFDVRRRAWSERIVEALGLRRDLLPVALESYEVAGRVSAEAAQEIGIPAGTPVAAGGGDQAMGAVGSGLVEEGVATSTIGTGGQLITCVRGPVMDPGHRVHTLCHAVPGCWILMGAILSAGLSLRWFREQLGEPETLAGRMTGVDPYDVLSQEAERAEVCSRGLVFLPYLCGERTPHMDPKARACFIGLTLSHTRAEMVRAIMEGVAFALRDCLSVFQELKVPVNTVICSGGGARSRVWKQIQADVYGTPVVALANDEHASYGAALVAGVASGAFGSVQEACEGRVPRKDTVYPVEENVVRYDRRYAVYRSLYPALRQAFNEIAEGV